MWHSILCELGINETGIIYQLYTWTTIHFDDVFPGMYYLLLKHGGQVFIWRAYGLDIEVLH